jgi:hypothetical protein
MIWKIASDGDILIARGYCQNETEVTTHFLPVVLTNDIPNTKPYDDDDVDSRVHLISYIQSLVLGESINRSKWTETSWWNQRWNQTHWHYKRWMLVGLWIEYYIDGNFTESDEVKN